MRKEVDGKDKMTARHTCVYLDVLPLTINANLLTEKGKI